MKEYWLVATKDGQVFQDEQFHRLSVSEDTLIAYYMNTPIEGSDYAERIELLFVPIHNVSYCQLIRR